MKLKLRVIVCGAFAASAVLCAVSAAALRYAPPDSGTAAPAAALSAESVPDTETIPQFTLRDYGGFIAIFTAIDKNKPSVMTDIEVRALPQADREMLQAGIPVYSNDELLALLEDMGS